MVGLPARAQKPLPDYAVKAAYLFNFGKFVRFAPSGSSIPAESFQICIVGQDSFGSTLDDLTANEKLDGKPVRVVHLKSAGQAHGCAVVYISAAEGNRVVSDVETLLGQQVLTVSDAPEFLRRGGMIQFVTVANHVRFAVNLEAVRKAQISLSSELLRVALSTDGDIPPGVRP